MDKELRSALDDVSQLNVLIIDDNTLVHGILTDILYGIGIRNVRCAENAFYALRLCEQMHFHVVICSFNVKSDKDGFHLLEELKFKRYVTKSTVLVFLSSDTDESLVNSIVELQPDDFWAKPLQPQLVQKRLRHTLQVKKQLFNIYQAVDNKQYSKAIYFADRHLLDKKLNAYFPQILRMKGESFLQLLEFKEAEHFFKKLLKTYQYSWVYIGYVKALLKQQRIDEIYDLLSKLTNKTETRFATHDMLAQFHIENEDYALAYEEIKKATKLAPRNIERNKKYWDLARLNHDHKGQYQATKKIAQYAKNSVHDSPIILLNVIRAGIDLACTVTDDSSLTLLNQSEQYIQQLESQYKEADQFKEQLVVAKARILNAKEKPELAERIIETQVSLKASPLIEDNLDKVKVFHELGMREEAHHLLNNINNQIDDDSLTSQVVSKYIEQEIQEREEIHYTPKHLHQMAVEHLEKNRFSPALDAIEQAIRLVPHSAKFSLTLMKILFAYSQKEPLLQKYLELGDATIKSLNALSYEGKAKERIIQLNEQWQEARQASTK